MRRFSLLIACVGALLVLAVPATATNTAPTGSRIGLFVPPASFPAGTPFHVEHGFSCALGDGACLGSEISSHSNFKLYVDSVLQPATVEMIRIPGGLDKLYLTNFTAGLPAGTHTFVGVWSTNGAVTLTATAVVAFT